MNPALRNQLLAPWRWLFESEGSTRSLALIRMGIVVNCWARWSNDHVLYRDLNPETLIVASLFFLSSTLTFIGLFTRVSSVVFAATCAHFVYVVGHEYGFEPYTHHHTTLLGLASILLALSPSGRSLSLDRYRLLSKQKPGDALPPESANLWPLRLMALQVASIYFWGAYDKLYDGFLSGDRMLHYWMYYYGGPDALNIPGLQTMLMLSAALTVLLEFALAFGLFFRQGRRFLILPGLVLHAAFYFALSVFTFTTTMWTLYLAFFDPDEVDRVLERLLRPEAKPRS